MSVRIAYKNFTGGEVSPTLTARYDLARFGTSVQCMENFLPGLHGDIARRPGTLFVADLGQYSMLIPFSFNVEADQNFCLILSDKLLRVSDGTRLLSASVETPYAAADLLQISWAQVGDIIYLAHPSYPLHKILRTDAPTDTEERYAWSIEKVILNESIPAPAAPSVTFNGEGGSYTLRYKVVAVDADGRESLASPAGAASNGKHPSDWVQGNSATISWKGVEGATEYNVYREEAGYFGFIGVHQAGNAAAPPSEEQQQALQNLLNAAKTKEGQRDQAKVEYDRLKTSYDAQCYITNNGSTSESTSQACRNLKAQREAALASYNALASEASNLRGQYNTLYNSLYPTFSFIDNNYEADTADTPKEDWDPFADGNYPATVSFHQQRMVLGGGKKSPQTFYMSRTGDFENFRKSRPVQDDDPVEYMVASGSIDAIQWLASFGELLIGTSGAEYKASGESGVITPKNASITAQSYWGSSGGLSPLIIGNSVMHVQRHGARVRDLFYSLEKDGYAGNDLSIMAPHLFDGHSLKQWAYQQTPGSNIWCVRDDGVLLCLTYLKEHEIYGWSRQLTAGEAVSVMSMSGINEDVIMLVVRRTIGGQEHYFLERMAGSFGPDTPIEDAYYVDCGITARRAEPSEIVDGLDHLEGCELAVLADGSPLEGLSVHEGRIEIPYPARVVHAGLPFASVLSPLPVETDAQTGSTLGKRRGYGKCVARLFRSVGGRYGAERGILYDFPFLPERYDEPCEPFSGDMEFTPGGGQEAETSVWLVQDRPLPMHIVALMCDVDFGEV